MESITVDIVRLKEAEDVDLEANSQSSLLHRSSRGRYLRRKQDAIELDDMPPIIKSANGNIFWADEQCTRRVGLTSTEARLFLRLLQLDEPENIIYDDFKTMFDDFGKEQERLKELVAGLPWWRFETHQQRKIWKARIEWLDRMRDPRLWLLYLMARRKRILKKATVRCLARFREKSQLKKAMSVSTPGTGASAGLGSIMISETSQTSDTQPNPASATASQILARPTMAKESSQTSGEVLNIQTPVPSKLISIAKGLRSSFSSERHSLEKCLIFDKPFEATRKDIKRQVKLLMPKPKPYIVIGWFLSSASDPKEKILEFDMPEHLFHILRHGEGDVRGWRRFISLKSLKGFGLYKVCSTLPLSHYLGTDFRSAISLVGLIHHLS